MEHIEGRPPLEVVIEACEAAGLTERKAILIWLRGRTADEIAGMIADAALAAKA